MILPFSHIIFIALACLFLWHHLSFWQHREQHYYREPYKREQERHRYKSVLCHNLLDNVSCLLDLEQLARYGKAVGIPDFHYCNIFALLKAFWDLERFREGRLCFNRK